MQFDAICDALARLERDNAVNEINLQGFELWPLIRFCIWAELIRPTSAIPRDGVGRPNSGRRIGAYLIQAFHITSRLAPRAHPGVTSLFISHPINLQVLPSAGLWFDRIVDPLYFLARNRERVEKLYVAPVIQGADLYFPARYLRPMRPVLTEGYSSLRNRLVDLYQQAGLPPSSVDVGFARAWKRFARWHRHASKFFDASPDLRKVYLSNWYFPEMMGLIAAARDRGILTIDVQHGKQGRYQSMYSWWTCIPHEGYRLLPDHFWCWGRPSCEHILASSPDRKRHRPIAGGFPWPDFYRRFLSRETPSSIDDAKESRRVLVTLQGPVSGHLEPIPDFIINHLRSDASLGDVFVFRGHPNFTQSKAYCEQRLHDVPPERYAIDDGRPNLYDELLRSTHHITAFSSCCYEAEMFGVPTLLFGSEAYAIYEEEIKALRFTWTAGEQSELVQWLAEAPGPSESAQKVAEPYIVSALSQADSLMQSLGQTGTRGKSEE